MRLDEAIDAVEGCQTVDTLKRALQAIVEDYGFASYAFVEISDPGNDAPLLIATSDPRWNHDYRSNGFLAVDPVLSVVRRANAPFTWADVPLPRRLGRRKPGALRTMEAARDHGLVEGLVIPFHAVDRIGRTHSASCVLFWKDRPALFARIPRRHRSELHVILIYWAQRALDLARHAGRKPPEGSEADRSDVAVALSDRERTTLAWAARGKTMAETAVILSISTGTVETHLRNAMAKLETVNKTQAAVRALKLGLIDV